MATANRVKKVNEAPSTKTSNPTLENAEATSIALPVGHIKVDGPLSRVTQSILLIRAMTSFRQESNRRCGTGQVATKIFDKY